MTKHTITEYPSQMLDAVCAWLKEVDMTADQIAAESGVNKWWIDRMRRGAITDPGIRRIQAVHDAMKRIAAKKDKKARGGKRAEPASQAA